jgi:hypothetical protein
VIAMTVGGAAVAALGQTVRPGEIGRAEVWIKNDDSETIPVRIHEADARTPLRVTVVSSAASAPVPVSVTRPQWEYQTVRVTLENAAGVLQNLGGQGWETTGVAWPAADATTLLMKRVR